MTGVQLLDSDETYSLPDRLMAAASLVAEANESGSEDLAQIAREIGELEAWTAHAPEYRPLRRHTTVVKELLRNLVRAFDLVLQALVAPSMAEAQELARELQNAIDGAIAANNEGADLLDVLSDVGEAANPTAALLATAIGDNPVEALAAGEAILDSNGVATSGSEAHLAALIWDTTIGLMSSTEPFWNLASQHADLLSQHLVPVEQTVVTDDFAARLSAATEDLLQVARLVALNVEPESIRAEVTDLLGDGHLIVEQPMKVHLGIACAATTRMSFQQTQACDVSELVNIANDKGWAIAGAVGSADLRNAFAHRDYEVRPDGTVELSPARCARDGRAAPTATVEELRDQVLAIVETCAAMEMAVRCVAGDAFPTVDLGHSAFLIRTIAEALLGWREVNVTQSATTAEVGAEVERGLKLAEIAHIVQPFIGRSEELLLRLSAPDNAQHTVRVSLPSYVRWQSATTDAEKLVCFLRLNTEIEVDGAPVMSTSHVSKSISVEVLRLLAEPEQDFQDLRPALQVLRGGAQELAGTELGKLIGGAIRWKASKEAGVDIDNANLDRLVEEAKQSVERPKSWIWSPEN